MRAKWLLLLAGGLPILFFGVFGLSALLSSKEGRSGGDDDQGVYKLSLQKKPTEWLQLPDADNKSFHYKIPFKIRRTDDEESLITDVARAEIVVKEDGKRVKSFALRAPKADDLTIVLVMDVSGSMEGEKIDEARRAARSFIDQLDPSVDVGLILFNHKILRAKMVPPIRDKSKLALQRERVRENVLRTGPQGGTAYLDATQEAVEMLRGIDKGRRAIVLMTDGRDVDSDPSLSVESIAKAANASKNAKGDAIQVYAIGIGSPAATNLVTTVLVLDQSGSMTFPASEGEQPKIEALKSAASRYVEMMPNNAETILMTFGDSFNFATIEDLIDDQDERSDHNRRREALKRFIRKMKAEEDYTKLFIATQKAIRKLAGMEGDRHVVVLTDGQDTERPFEGTLEEHRRDRVREMVALAKRDRIKVHTLGFGPKGEKDVNRGLDETVLQDMADGTGGRYFHAKNQKELYGAFENVSYLLYGKGINEKELKQLAHATGGAYYPARDSAKLQEQFRMIAEDLQSTYVVQFPSRYQRADGLKDKIEIYVERDGERISNVGAGDVTRRGLVVPEISHWAYLVLLAVLLTFLWLPTGMRRLSRTA